MKNDLKSSSIEEVERAAKTLKMVDNDIQRLTNYKNALEIKILDFVEIYEIDNSELKTVSVLLKSDQEKIPLKKLLEVFPNLDIKSIVENIVAEIKIDASETEENLRFSGDFQEPIIKSIMKQLKKLTNKIVKKVEIK